MSLRLPSDDDLKGLARANHFTLNDEELAAFRQLTPLFFGAYEQLYQIPRTTAADKVSGAGHRIHAV